MAHGSPSINDGYLLYSNALNLSYSCANLYNNFYAIQETKKKKTGTILLCGVPIKHFFLLITKAFKFIVQINKSGLNLEHFGSLELDLHYKYMYCKPCFL